jgi:hypothetical protein
MVGARSIDGGRVFPVCLCFHLMERLEGLWGMGRGRVGETGARAGERPVGKQNKGLPTGGLPAFSCHLASSPRPGSLYMSVGWTKHLPVLHADGWPGLTEVR